MDPLMMWGAWAGAIVSLAAAEYLMVAGGGGGGGSDNSSSGYSVGQTGAGGSGIVIVRYPLVPA